MTKSPQLNMVKGTNQLEANLPRRDIQSTSGAMDIPSVEVVAPEVSMLTSPRETLLDAGNQNREERPRPHFQQLAEPEVPTTIETRSKSWPAAPRGPALLNLQKRIESFQRRSNRLDAERNQALSVHMELKFVRESYRQQHKFVDESQRLFSDHVESMFRSNDFVTTREELFSHYGKARADYHNLQDQSSKLQALEDKLYSLEESMKKHQSTLTRTSERLLGWLRLLDPATRDSGEDYEVAHTVGDPTEQFSTDQDTDPNSETSSHDMPLLDTYFELAGWVKVFRARLSELLKEHDEKRVQRTHLEDQGVDLPTPEAEFERACDAERNAAETAVQDAIDRREQARAECLQQGINPEDHRKATSDVLDAPLEEIMEPDDSATHQLFPSHHDLTYENVKEPPVGLTNVDMLEQGDHTADEGNPDILPVADSVERWIESVEDEHIPPLLDHIGAEEATPRRRSPPSSGRNPAPSFNVSERDKEFLMRHGGTELLARLGLEVPASYKNEKEMHIGNARSTTMSDNSRSSSESRISALLKSDISQEELRAQLWDVRGRRRLR